MPDISQTIRTRTLADATVSGLVSTRMYSDALPQRVTLPAITYFVVDTIPSETLDAIGSVSSARIQIDCFATSRPAANTLADGVRLALQMQNHVLTGTQYILGISLDTGEQHTFDEPEDGSDRRRYVTTQDFIVRYRTTTS